MNKIDLDFWTFRILISPVTWILILLGVSFMFISNMDLEDSVRADQHYCNMVKLYQTSKGESGWPDYKNTYKTSCPK